MHDNWPYNRVPCLNCGDVLTASPWGRQCSCGQTTAKLRDDRYDADCHVSIYKTRALASWDVWSEDHDILVTSAYSSPVAFMRAELQGKPVGAAIILMTEKEIKEDLGTDWENTIGALPENKKLFVNCIDSQSEHWSNHPKVEDVQRVVEFARENQDVRILVHCQYGLSRSTSAVLAILADRLGSGAEDAAVAKMLDIRPCAIPNNLITSHADSVLSRHGKLSQAVDKHPLIANRRAIRSTDYGSLMLGHLLLVSANEAAEAIERLLGHRRRNHLKTPEFDLETLQYINSVYGRDLWVEKNEKKSWVVYNAQNGRVVEEQDDFHNLFLKYWNLVTELPGYEGILDWHPATDSNHPILHGTSISIYNIWTTWNYKDPSDFETKYPEAAIHPQLQIALQYAKENYEWNIADF